MKHLILSIIALALHYLADSSAQNDVVTYTDKTEQLDCGITSSTTFAGWAEGVTPIFEYTRESGVSKVNDGYENFSIDNGTSTSFHLIIADIRLDNEGQYRCTRSGGEEFLEYKVIVQVTPLSVDINNNGNEVVIVGGSYSFTCIAVGVRSPNVLNLTWSTNNVRQDVVPVRSESTQGSDLQDLTSTFELSPQKDDTFIKCGITGYVNPDEINEDIITNTTQLTVHYAPICALEFGETEISESGCTVTLTCDCDANPGVTTDGYSYFKDNTPIDVNGDTTRGNVASDATANFSCRGRNTIGSGDQSPAKEYTCSSLPTTSPPTTTTVSTTVTTSLTEITPTISTTAATTPTPMKTETPPSTEDPSSSSAVIIVVSCLGGILVVCVSGGAVYWFCFRNQTSSKSSHNLAASGGNTNPSYTEPAYDVVDKDNQPKSEVGITSAYTDNSDKLLNESTDKDFEVPQGGMNNTVTASAAATTNSAAPVYGVVNKSTKKKSDNTDGNGVNAKLAASQPETTEPAEYASVNKPKSQPQAAPRSSAPPEKMELQYADLDHGNRGQSNEVRQPTNEPTEYATVQSVIV